MFHIALLLLLAGHELRLRPVGVTSMSPEECVRMSHLLSVVTLKPTPAPPKVTKKDRDSIRTLLELAAKNFYDEEIYYRANGTEVIELKVNILRLKI